MSTACFLPHKTGRKVEVLFLLQAWVELCTKRATSFSNLQSLNKYVCDSVGLRNTLSPLIQWYAWRSVSQAPGYSAFDDRETSNVFKREHEWYPQYYGETSHPVGLANLTLLLWTNEWKFSHSDEIKSSMMAAWDIWGQSDLVDSEKAIHMLLLKHEKSYSEFLIQ